MNKILLYGLLSIAILSGCKKEVVPAAAETVTETVGRVSVKNIEFNYLTAKGQLKLEDKGETTSSGYTLRIKKDSVIWVSVQPGLGIEAARLKVTQDSVHLINRIHKEYLATDYSFLSDKFQVNMNYEVLQAILLGNYQAQGQEKVMDADQLQHIQQLRTNLLFDYFVGRDSQKLQQLNVKDQQTQNTIIVKYNNFQEVGQVAFAHEMAAEVQQKGIASTFTLNHTKVTTTDEILTFPFAVPSDYKRL
ncbi:DUF4292 domain-containing protein [Pontibacter sp. KCTC 32443]|uniref:DUF4292 domain-containing protein n=1 Tax=Pontibacter TaxID=323449 RepID=UPI00164EC2BC|nr:MULTISPECIES: DUF4292 domain-containing protein [Pontibacter]MBC5775646.1 DUF4292 domain-containing protein [Pontibacter sp. KCTC 32443]